MTLPADFADAHRRHWGDAEFLFTSERLGNADHLYGLSAECGLKAVMERLGMPLDARGRPPSRYATHVQDLWPQFVAFASGHGGARYVEELPAGTPFADWSHHDRYAREGHSGGAAVAGHRVAAKGIRRMVQAAEMDETL